MNKPTKPNITIPESFAENGVKADFDNNKILNGFDRLQPDILAGDNLNKFIDDTYKASNYALNLGDYIDEKVSKSGDTMTGSLFIQKAGSGQIQLINTSMDKTTPPASTQYNQVQFKDKNNQDFGFIQCRQGTDGSHMIQVGSKHPTENTYETFGIGYDKDGNGYFDSTAAVKNYMAKTSMPSTKSVVLTLNSSNSTFTAPANGWFYLQTQSSKASYAFINNTSASNMSAECAGSTDPKVIMPAQKGQVVQVEYDGTPKFLKFIYAEGSK